MSIIAYEGADVALSLTERENEILSQLSKGRANKEIADHLSISLSTVRTHLRHIYEKLRVQSRTEAAVKYLYEYRRENVTGTGGFDPARIPPASHLIH